ncbi:ADOP family duplicated permease [Acidicapsa dinghuensis]|uniref:ADOP family duplicated permease n=1 Tax=Acidicapsa dinghuensis TaxID=2218256 RepID=A0ABW1EJ90_9BACT|nr:ABC transporter permease [Acidicapsa dinghuensis]
MTRPGISDTLRTISNRIAAFFHRNRLDRDLDAELRSHIAHAIDENMAHGMSRSEARIAALRSFGGVTQTRETYRIRRGLPLFDQIARDFRYGWRQLVRAPGFALTAILTLALGLGANTAVFSLINALLLRPLPVPHAAELAIIQVEESNSDGPSYSLNEPELRALEKRHDAFSSTSAFFSTKFQLHGTSGSLQVPGQLVSGEYFATMQVAPLLGRYLAPADDVENGGPAGYAAVISENFWRTWFNSSPNAVGSKLIVANAPFTVVGVMPRGFFGADPTRHPSIFVPLSSEPVVDAPFNMIASGWSGNWLNLIARRKPFISLAQANAALQAETSAILLDSHPNAFALDDIRTNHLHFVAESGAKGFTYLRADFRKPLMVVFSLCGGVLLLACLNLASLLLARAAARERELATRLAIGATRLRLIRQLLIESLLIALLGTAAGLAVSPLVSNALAVLLLSRNPDAALDTSLDARVFVFAALIAVLSSILIGLLPALRATSGNLNEQIKSGSQARSRRDSRRLLPRLVMGTQVALALMLVTGAGLLAASLTRLYRTNLGFDPKGLVHLQLDMDKQPLAGDALLRWYQQFGEALSHQPGVQGVSFEWGVPLSGSGMTTYYRNQPKNHEQLLYGNDVAPGYFAAMRVPMLGGRDFRWDDTSAAGRKVILNQAAANLFFPGRSAVGQSIYTYDNKITLQVIAVVGNVHYRSIQAEPPPTAYYPISQTFYATSDNGPPEPLKKSYFAVIRLAGPPAAFAATARNLAARMAPEIPAPAMTSMTAQIDESISSERMMAMLAAFFGLCALLVTAIGLYGTLAYATSRRTSEIGIRIALGAQRTHVVRLVFRENAWVAVTGCLAGLIATLFASRALASILYSTSTHDPLILFASVASLMAVASAASLMPAIRAARIEPMEALRAE